MKQTETYCDKCKRIVPKGAEAWLSWPADRRITSERIDLCGPCLATIKRIVRNNLKLS